MPAKSEYRNFFYDDGTCKYCSVVFTTVKSCNLKRHIHAKHPELIFGNEVPPPVNDIKVNVVKQRKSPQVLHEFIAFVATSSATSTDLLQNEYLKMLMQRIPNFQMPSEQELHDGLEQESQKIRTKIIELLFQFKGKINITVDIGTTKNQHHSFLVVVASVYDTKCDKIRSMLLDICFIERPGDTDFINQTIADILSHYSISVDDVSTIITDSATEMILLFKHLFMKQDIKPTPNGDRSLNFINSSSQAPSFALLNNNDEIASVEHANMLNSSLCSRNLSTFESSFKRKECVANRLLMVLHDAFETNNVLKAVREQVTTVINMFQQSPFEALNLFLITNKALTLPETTYWPSLAVVFQQFSDNYHHINEICELHQWPVVSYDDLDIIKSILTLVESVKIFMTKLQSETSVTISLVYPGLQHLIRTIESSNINNSIKETLLKSIEFRFAEVLNDNLALFDPIYMIAAILDPVTAPFVDVGCDKFLKYVKLLVPAAVLKESEIVIDSDDVFGFGVSVKKECFANSDNSDIVNEAITFFNDNQDKGSLSTEAFWTKKKFMYPRIYELASTLFGVTATGISVEKVFYHITHQIAQQGGIFQPGVIKRKSYFIFNKSFL